MSFCYLLNAVLLFTAVIAFIVAGFAGTFSRRLHGCRYRLMLAPLGFLVLGSIAHSITERLITWFTHAAPVLHAGNFGSRADLFESAVLLLSGLAGALAGISLGATLDRVSPTEQTYTIANYWRHRSPARSTLPTANVNVAQPRENVIAISDGRKQPGTIRRVNAAPDNE